jgi:hypothetical protein
LATEVLTIGPEVLEVAADVMTWRALEVALDPSFENRLVDCVAGAVPLDGVGMSSATRASPVPTEQRRTAVKNRRFKKPDWELVLFCICYFGVEGDSRKRLPRQIQGVEFNLGMGCLRAVERLLTGRPHEN